MIVKYWKLAWVYFFYQDKTPLLTSQNFKWIGNSIHPTPKEEKKEKTFRTNPFLKKPIIIQARHSGFKKMVLKKRHQFPFIFHKKWYIAVEKEISSTYMFCFVKFIGMICYCDTRNIANLEVFCLKILLNTNLLFMKSVLLLTIFWLLKLCSGLKILVSIKSAGGLPSVHLSV